VKAVQLEQTLQRASTKYAVLSANANKLARVPRSNPLMETLGGFAVAAACSWRLSVVRSELPRQFFFFSFMTAFLLATEPAKRLARRHIDLNPLVGARMLLESSTVPAARSPTTTSRPEIGPSRACEFRDVGLDYRTVSGLNSH